MQNKKFLSLTFVIDSGVISAIHSQNPMLDAEYIKQVIKSAANDIEQGLLLNDFNSDNPRPLNIGDKLLSDANYIIQGGTLNNLLSEDI